MSLPKISIITPSYNQGNYLEETIVSVLNQNYPNLEYIIIDGGSTDESVSIIKKYADRITYWVSEADSGQSEAINKGLKMATGDIVAWLNSDDCYEEDTLSIIAKHFSENPDTDFLFGNCIFFDENTNSESLNKINLINFAAKQLGQFPYSQPSCFFKNDLLKKCGYLSTNLNYCLDVDLFIRFALNGSMVYTPHVLSRFRIHGESKTNNHWDRFLGEWIIIYSKTLRSLKADQLITFARELGLYHEGIDFYSPSTIAFSTADINKSFIYFLQRQMATIFPNGVTIKNYKKLKTLKNLYKLVDDKQLTDNMYLRKDQYYFFIKKHYLNPFLLIRKVFNQLTESTNSANINITPDDKLIKKQLQDLTTIPIIIINYNNLAGLKQLLNWLLNKGYTNIHVIDNNSDYEPLLNFYKTAQVNIIRLKDNEGHMVLWKKNQLLKKFAKGYYVVTDPDVLPKSDCPDDFMEVFMSLLGKNSSLTKVGFSLEIDDIPDTYKLKDAVIAWEKNYWKTKVSDIAFDAPLDTTFALYRPGNIDTGKFYEALRTDRPYTAYHLGWYIDSDNLTEEELHYINSANYSNSWSLKLEKKKLG